MTGAAIAVGVVVLGMLGALTLALVGAAGKRSRREETIRRCGGRANTFTPPPAAEWTPERLVEGGGLRRAQP